MGLVGHLHLIEVHTPQVVRTLWELLRKHLKYLGSSRQTGKMKQEKPHSGAARDLDLSSAAAEEEIMQKIDRRPVRVGVSFQNPSARSRVRGPRELGAPALAKQKDYTRKAGTV